MTQVLTLLTPSCVVQVSDRRVTRYVGGRIQSQDDVRNKAVVYLSLAAFGYTGAAEVGGRTDAWITEQLAPTAGLSDGFEALRAAATSAFRHQSLRTATLAIIGAGWDPKPDNTFVPFYVVISNYVMNELPRVREKRRSHEATAIAVARADSRRDEFDWYAVAFQPWMSCLLHVAGQPLPASRVDPLLRSARNAIRAGAEPVALIRLLAEEMWRVASTNVLVGSSLMAVSIPRTAARRSGPVELIGGPPIPGQITAMYLPGPGAGPIYYVANLAGAGACFIDASVEPL